MCMSTPGGIYCSSGAQWWRCCMLYKQTRIYCKTHAKALKHLWRPRWLLFFRQFHQLNWTGTNLIWSPTTITISPSAISSVHWIGIVGPFCGEALVKWAIIPVGESDDDFWQSAAAARCQTIRATAISSHGRTRTHRHARRLTPQTSCFSLSPQTWEIEWEGRGVMTEGRRRLFPGWDKRAGRMRRGTRCKSTKESRVRHLPTWHPELPPPQMPSPPMSIAVPMATRYREDVGWRKEEVC